MMRPLFEIATLKDDIESGALILTSNNRLAAKIRQAWGMYQHQGGKRCWPQPDIYAIEQWIDEQWLCCCDAGSLDSPSGAVISQILEQILWETVIDEDSEKPATLLPANFSALAQASYSIVQRWKIPRSELREESPYLHRWIKAFRQKLEHHQLITPADRVSAILQAYECGRKQPHPRIVTVGFDSIPPLYQSLLAAAAHTLGEHSFNAPRTNHQKASPHRARFYDEAHELTAVATWAYQTQRQNPEHRIGVIIPELARKRRVVERIFRQVMEPDHQLPNHPHTAPPFNISAGTPLSDTPLVAAALLLLSLNRTQLPLESFCRLLNSPFWGGDQSDLQTNIRVATETRLRKLARHQITTSEFRNQVFRVEQAADGTESDSISLPELSKLLEKVETLRRAAPAKASFQQWLTLFQQQLDTLKWPGHRSLDSIEFQQYQHWLQTLEQYPSLDHLQSNVSLMDALRQLKQLADHCIFQAETADAPIQVLGLLESSDLRFDHLWVSGIDNHSWPPSISPNPLLPISLQRKYGTPRSQPEQELQIAKKQLNNFKQAADHVIFSFSEFDTNRQRMASSLIADIPEIESNDLPEPIHSVSLEALALDKVNCEYGPPLLLENNTEETQHSPPFIRGGSSIFKDQASCPFNAFAKHRLGAHKPPEPVLGLSSMDRGTLLHNCLEQLWQQLGSQQQLLVLSNEALNGMLTDVVTSALQQWKKKRPDIFGPQFTNIETKRLVLLLEQWLALEKTRPEFKVTAFEKCTETTFAGLPLKLIVDRVDETSDGQQIIIDYKTGSANTSSWLGARPEQPQLPLYVLCSEEPVAAATFGIINVTQQQFTGFSKTPKLLPNVQPPSKKTEPEDWDELITQWRQALTQLAGEFQQGYAAVKFFKPSALQYQQELTPLNRLAELSTARDGGTQE